MVVGYLMIPREERIGYVWVQVLEFLNMARV